MKHFELQSTDAKSSARAGTLRTEHGEIQTPAFMPVGTNATVKAVSQQTLTDVLSAPIVLANTYHLHLRPGAEVIDAAGGIHQFMNWSQPVLTDSGGYQVFSLARNRTITREGVKFRSHIDGSLHLFTPESVIDIQRQLGADIIMAFDECTPYPATEPEARESMNLTHSWLSNCVDHFNEAESRHGYEQFLYPIIQGGTHPQLRQESAEVVCGFDLPGVAIGGLSVGEPAELLYAMTQLCCDIIAEDKCRYLMGVGTPENLLRCIALGVDIFDCVMPTRHARNAHLFTSEGVLNMRNEKWKQDFSPIDPHGPTTASTYSKAYLRHLFLSDEILACEIATIQNLSFYFSLMRTAREKILANEFSSWYTSIIPKITVRL